MTYRHTIRSWTRFQDPFYGDHVALFTLLITISTIIYTEDEYADDRSDESVDETDDVPDADFLPRVSSIITGRPVWSYLAQL